jgi:hypothetical protein
MAKRSKKPRDINAMAAAIVNQATDETDAEPNRKAEAGRLGGLRGGKARANKLSKERRSEIAKKAAAARWKKS